MRSRTAISATPLRFAVRAELLRDSQRFLAKFGFHNPLVAARRRACLRAGVLPGTYLPVSTPRAIGLYGTTPMP